LASGLPTQKVTMASAHSATKVWPLSPTTVAGERAVAAEASVPLVREIVERDEWNALVLAVEGDLRQSWEWGELRRAAGWRAHRYAAFAGGEPLVAISAVSRGLPGLSVSVAYASRGPVLHARDARAWAGLVAAARAIGRRAGAVMLRLSPSADGDDADLVAALRPRGFTPLDADWTTWNAPRVIMTLDIRGGEPDLKRRMRESTRLGLTRAVKHGARIDADVSGEAVRRFHALLSATARRKRHPVQPLGFFETLRREYLARGTGSILLSSLDGRDLAGVLGVRFGRRAYLLYSAIDTTSAEARNLRPGVGLHWEFIRWAKAQGCDSMDWGGAVTSFPPRREDPGFGVYDFKLGFGCSLQCLAGYYDLVLRPVLYPAFRAFEQSLLPWAWKLRARLTR